MHREGAIFARPEAQGCMESVSATILLVEDDQTTRRFLADNLAGSATPTLYFDVTE